MRRLAYKTQTGTKATGANFAAAPDIFDTDATFTAAGSIPYLVELYIPMVETASGADQYVDIRFDVGNTDIALVSRITRADGSRVSTASVYARFYYTFSAGTVNVNMRGVHVGAAGTLYGNQGLPMALAIYGPAIT
jgi:hypothetical protein